jgi:hypothetical protein
MMRRLVRALALVVILGVGMAVTALPPAPVDLKFAGTGRSALNPRGPSLTVAGAYHVHSVRSDGAGTPEEIADAAARADLRFVILTDHGDGTRRPDPLAYRAGVLMIDAVELSTTGGHYVALGLPQTPFRLAGDPSDVVEDVRRLGGFGVAAHPDSLKDELAWRDWNLPMDGIEWLNIDSSWRAASRPTKLGAVLGYPARPSAAVLSMLDDPRALIVRWDKALQTRRLIGLAAVDAHGQYGEWEGEAGRSIGLRVPSYESQFNAVTIHAQLEAPLTGDAAYDGKAVIDAIRRGRVFSSVRALAWPVRFQLRGSRRGQPVMMGDEVEPGVPLTIAVSTEAPRGATIRLFQNGRIVREHDASESLAFEASGAPAAYRAEVWLPSRWRQPDVPWIVSNPISVRPQAPQPGSRILSAGPKPLTVLSAESGRWHTEQAAGCVAKHSLGPDNVLRFDYALGTGPRAGQYAALASEGIAQWDTWRTVRFSAWASRPMRLSVQLRRPGGTEGRRWSRSIYVDQTPRDVAIPAEEFRPVAGTSDRPPLADVHALLLVVDTVNTPPGSTGTVWVDSLRIE